jgi:ribonuclease HI
MLQNLVPSSILQKLHAIVPPSVQQGTDTQFWPGTSVGQFTVAAAYHLLAGPLTTDREKKWSRIWKIESTERIKAFIWQLTHDRLMTKARLASWQLGNSLCHQCLQFEENTLHVVRDCKAAVHVWRHLLSNQERGHFFTVEFHEWINLNLNNKVGMRFGDDWTAIWATTCFLLWQWRNKSLHDDEFVYPDKPWQVIINYVDTYKMSIMAEDQLRLGRTRQQMNIAWLLPSTGWIALNTDGAAKAMEKKAGCGGVLRDDKGSWIDGFAKALGDTTAYMAELWGIHEGLALAYRRRVMKLELRTDSQVLAQSLKERKNGSVPGCALMKKIIELLDGPWEVQITHVYREANRCADMLANMGSEGSSGINYFENPPTRVLQIVEDDARGVSFPRLISL